VWLRTLRGTISQPEYGNTDIQAPADGKSGRDPTGAADEYASLNSPERACPIHEDSLSLFNKVL
jgi:hypothetical protein